MSASVHLTAALLGTLTFPAGPARSQAPPTFTATTERVRVDVVVSRQGRPVRNLTQAHFDLIEDGTRQVAEVSSGADLPVQVILVLDTSDSMAGDKLEQLKTAGQALIENLTERDCAAVVAFSYNARLRTTSCAGRAEAAAGVAALTAGGTTALYDALYASLLMADAGQGRTVLLVLSDGEDKASWFMPDEVLQLAKSVDATVYSVSLSPPASPGRASPVSPARRSRPRVAGRAPGVQLLADLTGETGGRVLAAEGDQDLKQVFLGVMEEVRNRYVLHYEPSPSPRPGWHKLEVQLRNVPGATARARPGYSVVR